MEDSVVREGVSEGPGDEVTFAVENVEDRVRVELAVVVVTDGGMRNARGRKRCCVSHVLNVHAV